jgi:hypothetical protein
MLPVSTMGIRPPSPQNGAPIHRVRTHSLSRVRDSHVSMSVSSCPCLHTHVSMFMSPWPCLHGHVSMSMFSCPYLYFHVFMSNVVHVSMYPFLHVSTSHVYVPKFACLHLQVSVSMSPWFWNSANGKHNLWKTATSVCLLQMENGARKRQASFCFLQTETENGSLFS